MCEGRRWNADNPYLKYKQAWEELKATMDNAHPFVHREWGRVKSDEIKKVDLLYFMEQIEKERGILSESKQPDKDISKPPVRTFYGIPVG